MLLLFLKIRTVNFRVIFPLAVERTDKIRNQVEGVETVLGQT